MGLLRLDHFAIVTHNLEETIKFYQDIVGLVHGARPAGGFGEFLYFPNTTQQVIHLLSAEKAKHVDNDKAAGFQVHGISADISQNTGSVDHIAFKSTLDYYYTVLERVKNKNIPHRLGKEMEPKIMQLWFFDPNKIKVEVTYTHEDM